MGCGSSTQQEEPKQPEQKQEPQIQQKQKAPMPQGKKAMPPPAPKQKIKAKPEPEEKQQLDIVVEIQPKSSKKMASQKKAKSFNLGLSSDIAVLTVHDDCITDLTKNFFKEPINLGGSYYNMFAKLDIESFQATLAPASKVVFIFDLDTVIGLRFAMNQIERLTTLEPSKIQILAVTTNTSSGADPASAGKYSEVYNIWFLTNSIQEGMKLTIIDRKTWATCNAATAIKDIVESDETVGFYPSGVDTYNSFIEYVSNSKDLFDQRFFVQFFIKTGQEEMKIFGGQEKFEAIFGGKDSSLKTYDVQTSSDIQPFQTPLQYDTVKKIVALGSESKKYASKFSDKLMEFDELQEGLVYNNKEICLMIDQSEKLPENFYNCKFAEDLPGTSFIGIHIVPMDEEAQKRQMISLMKLTETCKFTLLIEEGHEQNEEFLDKFINMDGNWTELAKHFSIYTRHGVVIPLYEGQSMFNTIEPFDTAKPVSLLSGITFDKDLKIDIGSFIRGNNNYNRLQLIPNEQNKFSIVTNFAFTKQFVQFVTEVYPAEQCVEACNNFLGDTGIDYNGTYDEFKCLIEEIDYYSAEPEMECCEGD